ncbi:MAG TPA: phosphoribosylpyrophosphate synthetase [Pricia antarctica]|uniref:Phosphoribosylpyrophosphate synthetase n=1 Tax=Pricia antarctica TaxID=641691 RepID=A0A831QRF0_9FLAO|nr:phosphoribosylpyrophosphate synthetase [Pricia antarctica]
MNNQYTEIMEALAHLREKGYSDSFDFITNRLHCLQTKRFYEPEAVSIIEYHRFEGASDPEDMSILYAVETDDGTKGTVIDAYGTYADTGLGEFLKRTELINP